MTASGVGERAGRRGPALRRPGVREDGVASGGHRGKQGRAGRGGAGQEGTSCQGLGLPSFAKEVLPEPKGRGQEVGRRLMQGCGQWGG